MSKINTKIVLMAALSIIFAAVSFAQVKVNIPKGAIKNLIAGINSDNYGLRRTSIYFAGEYKVEEAGNALIEAFKKEPFPANKILIAYSLYRIRDQKSFENLSELLKVEKNTKVKTICGAVVEQYNEDNMMGLK